MWPFPLYRSRASTRETVILGNSWVSVTISSFFPAAQIGMCPTAHFPLHFFSFFSVLLSHSSMFIVQRGAAMPRQDRAALGRFTSGRKPRPPQADKELERRKGGYCLVGSIAVQRECGTPAAHPHPVDLGLFCTPRHASHPTCLRVSGAFLPLLS